jgi:hypothetical protein
MAQEASSNVVVSYSFDDDNVATVPDTFRVFNFAKGNVNLTTTYCHVLLKLSDVFFFSAILKKNKSIVRKFTARFALIEARFSP